MLDIFLYGKRAAVLQRRGRGDYRLRYDEGYLADPDAVPLSTRLPLQHDPHRGDGLLRVLEGFLPDRTEVLERWAREAGLADTEAFGLIAAYGEDVAGAAVFVPSGSSPDLRRRLTPLTDYEIADRIRAVREDAAEWVTDAADHRFSLAGAQGKFALARRDDRWHEPADVEPSTHIFKPGIEKYPESDILEHVTMALAGRLGLPVAHTTIQTFHAEHILVVERFDRMATAQGTMRVHQEDLAQATGTSTLQKYEVDGGPGVSAVVDVIRRHADPESQQPSLLAFGASLVFAWLVAHNDGHAKNYSLRLLPHRTELTPLYDVNSYLPYLDPRRIRAKEANLAHEVELAFSIGEKRRIGEIDHEQWRNLERMLRLPRGTLLRFGIGAADRMVTEANAVLDSLDEKFQTDRMELFRTALFARRASALAALRSV